MNDNLLVANGKTLRKPTRLKLTQNDIDKFRNRPEIRLNPVPAGFPALKSGSGSGPVWNRFAGFQPELHDIFNSKL